MKGRTKRPKIVALETREILAANVRTRMDEMFSHQTDKAAALAKRCSVSKSTVNRALIVTETGISIDTLHQLAMGLHCEPADLLTRPSKES